MHGKLLAPLSLAILIVPAIAHSPIKLSPVLPEVTKNIQEAQADVAANTFPLARAHAELVLLDQKIPYSVSLQGVPESRRKQCLECLTSAVEEWQRDLDGAVTFEQAAKGEATNVVIRFRPSVTMNKEQVAGYVSWTRNLKTESDGSITPVFKADLQIRVKDLEGNNMPPIAMRHAAMHELGHVLGLDDSPRQGDVMGPLDIDNPVSSPTPLEIQTVKSFRDQASEILREAKLDPHQAAPEPKS